MPSQMFTHEATAHAPADQVWKVLNQPDTWESIGGVDRVFDPKVDDEGRLLGFSFETVAGGRRHVGSAGPNDRVEGERIAWNVNSTEMRGVTSVTLYPTDRGTTIAVVLQVESVGLLSSLLFPVIAAAIGTGLAKAVDEFARGFDD